MYGDLGITPFFEVRIQAQAQGVGLLMVEATAGVAFHEPDLEADLPIGFFRGRNIEFNLDISHRKLQLIIQGLFLGHLEFPA